MAGSDPSKHLDPAEPRARLLRLRPLRVLVVSADERFRAVSSMLIARRGCEIFTAAEADRLAELIAGERIDVVVMDGDVEWAELSVASASLEGFSPLAGLVAVAERAGESSGRSQLARWGEFEDLFAAIEDAELRRGAPRAADCSASPPAEAPERGGV
jgi:hypothetical protein